MAERKPRNMPPQTGIIDFLRRLADVDNTKLLDDFNADPVHTMSIAGLTQAEQDAIMSSDNARIAAAVGTDYLAVHSPDYIRRVQVVSKKTGLNFTFPDDSALRVSSLEIISNLRRSVDRVIAQLDGLSANLE